MTDPIVKEEYRVDIIESELGRGSKVDESKYFPTYHEASTFVTE
jgi:hypothetical protein